MSNNELMNRGLPKWPGLLVSGTRVTEERAAEIIIRTSHWMPFTNDRAWEDEVREISGYPDIEYPKQNPDESDDDYMTRRRGHYDILRSARDEWEGKYGILNIGYLNNCRIASAWIFGPHGWIDWNGSVFCNTFNIGKWPSVESVYQEWETIAQAFPWLYLRSQLLDQEIDEDGEARPVVEFVVHDGTVDLVEPKEPIHRPAPIPLKKMTHDLANPYRERGCDSDTLRWAMDVTEMSCRKIS